MHGQCAQNVTPQTIKIVCASTRAAELAGRTYQSLLDSEPFSLMDPRTFIGKDPSLCMEHWCLKTGLPIEPLMAKHDFNCFLYFSSIRTPPTNKEQGRMFPRFLLTNNVNHEPNKFPTHNQPAHLRSLFTGLQAFRRRFFWTQRVICWSNFRFRSAFAFFPPRSVNGHIVHNHRMFFVLESYCQKVIDEGYAFPEQWWYFFHSTSFNVCARQQNECQIFIILEWGGAFLVPIRPIEDNLTRRHQFNASDSTNAKNRVKDVDNIGGALKKLLWGVTRNRFLPWIQWTNKTSQHSMNIQKNLIFPHAMGFMGLRWLDWNHRTTFL